MASLTLAVSEEFKNQLKSYPWVNWSEIARIETMKRLIFEDYMKTGEITKEEWEFCEKIDWHPVDELPLKEKFVKEMKKRSKGRFIKVNNINQLFK